MEKLRKFVVAALIASGLSMSASAQEPRTIVGVWSLGETHSCETGPAWVFFADGFYAEVQLPDGNPTAVGIWRDEGEAIAYTHAHMPFDGHENPMRVRHLTVEERTPERLQTRNYRGGEVIFNRCPSKALQAPASQGEH